MTRIIGTLLIGVCGNLIAAWIWYKPDSIFVLLVEVASFYLPVFLSFIIAYATLRLKKSKRVFSESRTISVDMCWFALVMNLLVLLPESILGKVDKVNWHHQPFGQNIFVVLGLLVGTCLVLCLCLYEQAERRAIYAEGVYVSREDLKVARREEYVASFLAAMVFMSNVALFWYAGADRLALLFKVVSSSIVNAASVVWYLRWENDRLDRQQLDKMIDNLIAKLVKDGFSVPDAHETLIGLGEMNCEIRRETIKDANLAEMVESILLKVSEQGWRNLVDVIKKRRR